MQYEEHKSKILPVLIALTIFFFMVKAIGPAIACLASIAVLETINIYIKRDKAIRDEQLKKLFMSLDKSDKRYRHFNQLDT